MASVHLPATSKIWRAFFVDASGKRLCRSTGETERRVAQKIADAYEAASRRKMTVAQVQRTMRDLMADAQAGPVPGSTIREYFLRWVNRKLPEVSEATAQYYRISRRHFLRWCSVNLPARGRTQMVQVTADDIAGFRGYLLNDLQLTGSTVNHRMKFLRMVFSGAVAESILIENPMAVIGRVRRHQPADIRPFTPAEVKSLTSCAGSDEWRSMILFGFYTGQRMGDVAFARWQDIHVDRGEWSFTMRKTGKRIVLPLPVPLVAALAATSKLDRLGFVHALAAEKLARYKQSSRLSNEFWSIMARAGIVEKRSGQRIDPAHPRPRSGPRYRTGVGFHSLRHTAGSMMREAGCSVGVAMEILGHRSRVVHEQYAHFGIDVLRRGVDLLPKYDFSSPEKP